MSDQERQQLSITSAVPFPAVWDNTMRASLADCPQKCNIEFFHSIRPATNNVNLHAGGAFAKGMETLRRVKYDATGKFAGEDAQLHGVKALIKEYGDFDPGDSVKSCEGMVGALDSYINQYNPETDHIKPFMHNGEPAVEFNFAHPIEVLHPETQEPIIYCGRFDMLGVLNNDEKALFVVDEKTTKALGPTWPRQWGLRSQFMGYCWGAKKFGYPVVGAVVRGVAILKRSYSHAEAIVYFEPWKLDRWYSQLCDDITDAIAQWKRGKFRYNFATHCSSYGGCPFRMLCESENPNQWLENYYRYEKWDPMRIGESGE